MDMNIDRKSKEQMMAMPVSELDKIIEISGVGLIVNNGEITAMTIEDIPVEEIDSPVAAVLIDALRDVYGQLSNAKEIIDGLVDYVYDNIVSVETSGRLGALFHSDGELDYGAFSRSSGEPDDPEP